MLIFMLVGCSGSGGNPSVPKMDDTSMQEETSGDPAELTPSGNTDRSADTILTCPVLLGYIDVVYDPETGTIEAVPLRTSEITLNLTRFLQPPMPNNFNVAVADISQIASGRLDVDLSVTHPFPTSTDLRGFDLMVILMGDGSLAGIHDSTIVYPATNANDLHVINADGYTRWWNATEFTQAGIFGFDPGIIGFPGFNPSSTINGYKWYSDSLGATSDIKTFFGTPANIAERGSWAPGGTSSRRFELQFPMVGGTPDFHFQYAILVNWNAVDPLAMPPFGINDYPIIANLMEPFYVDIADNGSDLFFVDPSTFGGNLRLSIEVFDWQGMVSPAGVPGEISHIRVEEASGLIIPGGSIDALTTATVSAGLANSSVFNIDISGCMPILAGRQDFLVTVESASPTDYSQGLAYPYPTGAALSCFQRTSVLVGNTNPCPAPNITSLSQTIANVNDVVTGLAINGTNFQAGAQLAAVLRRSSGNFDGTNETFVSSTQITADFDFTGATVGMYNLAVMNGCGTSAPLQPNAFEVNTPPTSTGITGPTSGDATLGNATYNANASDSDTDPVDILSYSWTAKYTPTGIAYVGPTPGDPFIFNFGVLSVGSWDIDCTISDGYPPADLGVTYPVTRINTAPTVNTPTGQNWAWDNDVITYSTVATELDPFQNLTYNWSFVTAGSPASYTLPGDPVPGDFTLDFSILATIVPGLYDLSCEVDDGSGAPNAKAVSPILQIQVWTRPYTDPVPLSQFDQVVVPVPPGPPVSQGWIGCPMWWDGFYNPGPPGAWPQHPDIALVGGPSSGVVEMVIADEMVIWSPVNPVGMDMGFVHFPTPFVTGAAPVWIWTTSMLFPTGSGMTPACVHFDGSSNLEFFLTNSQMTNALVAFGVFDPAAIEHYDAKMAPGPNKLNDLYTTNGMAVASGTPDVAVDVTAGFDMGSPVSPATPNMYGLYTQDQSGILFNCTGPAIGPVAANPINILLFPSMGAQLAGTAVDAAGPGIVAPMMAGLTSPIAPSGPNVFGFGPGGVSVGGALAYPEPYYALAIDDDPSDNPPHLVWPTINYYVLAATIDSDRDLEIYQLDFGVPAPGPAPLMPYASMQMPNFMQGNPMAYPIDCEFISNFSGFGGTAKPVWQNDLLAVLLVEPIMGAFTVEIFEIQPIIPRSISISMPVPIPPMNFLPGCMAGGCAYRLDVDEITGDIYVLHESMAGGGGMGVTIFTY